MLSIIALVISIVFAVNVLKKLDDMDVHLKELLASREDDETPPTSRKDHPRIPAKRDSHLAIGKLRYVWFDPYAMSVSV